MAGEKMQLEDWLDDLCVRFIINLPEEDLSSVARICFQIEEAQWFYEDFVRPLDPTLPSMSLRNFSLRIFQHCPLLAPFSVENHTRAFEEFLQYKTRVPVRGAILLNEVMDSTVLVKGWKKGAHWSFPRGKINKNEDDLECAIREVYEETGYDLHATGLVPKDRNVKYIEITMREQQMRLYVFRNVPMDTQFAPRTRKEISKIQWYGLSELPAFRRKGNNQTHNNVAAAANANKFYMVAPFLVPLKKWVVQQKKRESARSAQETQLHLQQVVDEPVTEDDSWARSGAMAAAPEQTTSQQGKPALDTLEGATLELQRLLKIQPAAQRTASPTGSNQDKGLSLLALLQSNSGDAEKSTISRTSLDHTISQAPQPSQPQDHHHSQQWAPLESYQPPPAFPLQHTQPQQHRGPQPGQPQHYQQPAVATPRFGRMQPLSPPQPLPPQALIDQARYLNAPPLADLPGGQIRPAGEAGMGQIHPNGRFRQNAPPHARQATKQLTTQSLALLDVLKSDNKPKETILSPGPAQAQSIQGPASPSQPPQNVPVQGTQPHQRVTHGSWEQNIPLYMRPDTGRGGTVSDQRRSTLLQMFQKTDANNMGLNDGASPSSGELLLKQKLTTTKKSVPGPAAAALVSEIRSELPTNEVAVHPQSRFTPNAATDFQQQQPSQPMYAHSTLPRATQRMPSQSTGQQAPLPTYKILQRTENMTNPGATRPVLLDPAVAAPYKPEDKPSSLASPPATSSFPTPAALQRKQSMSNDQRQKLLSLFGKPESTSPASAMVAAGSARGFSLAASPHPGSAASAPTRPPAGPVAEAQRGSQTPISPADRSFLLSYLASATGNTQ